jgi:hypothetical protein
MTISVLKPQTLCILNRMWLKTSKTSRFIILYFLAIVLLENEKHIRSRLGSLELCPTFQRYLNARVIERKRYIPLFRWRGAYSTEYC